jgi:hypothetical protein
LAAAAEDAVIAKDFPAETVARNGREPHTVHADRGGAMVCTPVSELPLETYETVVDLITNTTTTTGLTIRCELDPGLYPTEIKLADQQKKSIPITRHQFHGDWN